MAKKEIASEVVDAKVAMESESEMVFIHFPGIPEHVGVEVELAEGENLIHSRRTMLGEATILTETFDASPNDGAYCFDQVMKRRFGWTQGMTIKGFWGDRPPQMMRIEIGPREYASVPWGRVVLPKGDGGYMELGAEMGAEGVFQFSITAHVLKKHEKAVVNILAEVRKELEENSIYFGKVFGITLTDSDGDPLAIPKIHFLDTSKVNVKQLVLRKDTMAMVNASLFYPITNVKDLIANRMRVKRGVLLAGDPGVGKTLITQVASRLAADSRVTYIALDKTSDFRRGLAFAKQYQKKKDSVVVMQVEDIDRITSGKRDEEIDRLLSDMDGIDSKTWNFIVVATTNDMKSILSVVKRPGRFDARIKIPTPDVEAAVQLMRNYGDAAIAPQTDLSEAGLVLAGTVPADIEEAVQRSKLMQLAMQEPGTLVENISAEALLLAAKQVRSEVDDAAEELPKPPTLDSALRGVVAEVLEPAVDRLAERFES